VDISTTSNAPSWQALVTGRIILIGTLFERWRYRGVEQPPGGQWQKTGEQFLDPSTGDPIEVMFDPRTGERRYVAAASPGPKKPSPLCVRPGCLALDAGASCIRMPPHTCERLSQ
jgi:hypothetical protein